MHSITISNAIVCCSANKWHPHNVAHIVNQSSTEVKPLALRSMKIILMNKRKTVINLNKIKGITDWKMILDEAATEAREKGMENRK